LKVVDGRKKLLMPGAEKDGVALFQKILPIILINDVQTKTQTIQSDKIVGKNYKGTRVYQKLQFFKHKFSF